MSTKGVLKFIDDLTVNYSFRRDWDEEREKNWSTLMVRELGGFQDDVLARACREIILTRGKRPNEQWMPTIAECLKACREAQFLVDGEKNEGKLKLSSGPLEQKFAVWSDHRRKLADDLIMTPQGKRAAEEGWILGLHNYIREHGEAPRTPADENKLRTASREFEEEYRKCLNGGFPLAGTLASLGTKMLKRREELAEMVLHGVVR